jgi:hypothetical protein
VEFCCIRFSLTKCLKSSLDTAAKSAMHPAYSLACRGGKRMLIMKETLCKNNLNFLTDRPMIYVDFIVIVCTVSEKKAASVV